MELLFKLDVCEKTGICFRASEVNLPSGICLLQHLEPYGIRIFWCRKTEFLSLVGTTISLGPGRLQMKQRAWLVADEGSGRVTEGGLLAYLEELPCCCGENNVSFGAVSFFSMCFLSFTWHLIRHAVQSTSSSDGSDTHIFCTNCFSSAVSVRLSVGFVRFLHRIHGNSRFPVPGICLNENNRCYIDCQLYAILFTTFTTKINKLCNLFYCEPNL